MEFLRWKSSGRVCEVDYICEGQISILIAAIDHRVWTGYCFVDTYYQPESRRQAVGDYCKAEIEADVIQPDPFADGECDANQPILDANEYFFTTLECNLRVVKDEWTNTVHQMGIRVAEYV